MPWVGRPTDAPAVATRANGVSTTVWASWNGALGAAGEELGTSRSITTE
jgi:hypothetical protein